MAGTQIEHHTRGLASYLCDANFPDANLPGRQFANEGNLGFWFWKCRMIRMSIVPVHMKSLFLESTEA